jgi:hypothetical protein
VPLVLLFGGAVAVDDELLVDVPDVDVMLDPLVLPVVLVGVVDIVPLVVVLL